MRRTEKGIDVAGLLLELERIGVHWRRSSGGCWMLAGGPVPGWLLDALSGVDHRRLIAAIEEFVHRREGVA